MSGSGRGIGPLPRRRHVGHVGTMKTMPHVALVACLLAAPAHAQTRPLSYDDYYAIRSVSSTALAPDGSTVAYIESVVDEGENRTRSKLHLVATDGQSAPVRLLPPSSEEGSPRWSPDGALLAFSRTLLDEGGGSATWFVRPDDLDAPFQIEGLSGVPVFDPTNRYIAFTRAVPPAENPPAGPELTAEERKIVDRFDGRSYDWMQFRFDRRGYLPDPTDPWATPPSQVFVVPRRGGEPRQLTGMDVDASGLDWRPDGQAIAFAADEHQRDEHSYPRADLWTVDLDGSVTRLTDDEFNWGGPVWSPRGDRLVSRGSAGLDVVIRERWDHGAPTDLWLFSADGAERRNLTSDFDLIPGDPVWSADGSELFFSASVGGDSHLFRLQVATGGVEQVSRGEGRRGSVSYSADRSVVAYVGQSPTHPGDVFAGPLGGDAEQLTSVNARFLEGVALQVPERLLFPSADGTEIEGWLMAPVDYSENDGREWPLILNIHGGPHGAYGNSFSFDFQLQAAKGYFVLYTNPRASTGYGEDFRWATWGSWGDEDYDDVMAGLDVALDRFPIDVERLGVTGYSYGGFLTNWIITQTDRFAAAVAGAGISNWVSDYAVADIPRTKETEFYGTPWEEEGLRNLLASSPVVHAGGVSTPTLFVHGESDHRVPIEEAEQMYVALKKQQVPAKMIRYPDSYHGGWTPWRYVHRLYSTLEWWEQWLGEKPIS